MEPTIRAGDTVGLDVTLKSPSRWDVVVFEAPEGKSGNWLSRVVGLPGETIEIKSGDIVINGHVISRPPHVKIPGYRSPSFQPIERSITFPYIIPPDHFFVMGDNTAAIDSRYWGALEQSKITGVVPGK